MFIWRLWGDVWTTGSSSDYLADMAVKFLLTVLLIALTLAVLIPVLLFMALRAGFGAINDNRVAQAVGSGTVTTAHHQDPACPHCGNTSSRDIVPCVRCGC